MDNIPPQPIDQPQRSRALDTTASFAVSAPAGSGKTGLLTQRVLALLAQCDEPENVLAITFTKKAAAEMQARILEALHHAEQHSQEPEEDYLKTTWHLARAVLLRNTEKQWELFSCPNRLRVTTIDSLCRSLSQQMPFESKLGNTPEILDNPNIAYQMAARETLAHISTQNDLQEPIIHLVKHVDNKLDTIENLLIQLLGKRDQWLPVLFQSKDQRGALEHILVEVIEEQLLHIQEQLAPISSELGILADHAAHNFTNPELSPKNPNSPITHCLGLLELPAANIDSIPQWEGIAELLLTQKKELRKKPTKDIGFFAPSAKCLSKEQQAEAKAYKQRFIELIEDANDLPELATSLSTIITLPSPYYSDKQWQLLDSLTHVLINLVQNLTVAFQQLGKTDYLAVTLAALDALGEPGSPTDLALALDYKIQHILVDEFQDTSTTQLTLLKRLTAGWQVDDGRTLFVVGDAMQSCYRFRDANVGIFLDVREQGLGDIYLEALDLQVNFRSQQQIVDWVNQSFEGIFPDQDDSNRGAVHYSPSVSFNAALDISAVQTHLLAYQDNTPSPRKDEANTTVNIIQEVHQTRPDDSIALLVRGRAHAQDIIHALNAANISYQATDIDRLNTCMPVLDGLSLTKALLYPNDRLAWLAVLRAPWCGLHMADLLAVAQYNKTDKQWPLLLHSISHDTIEQSNLSASGYQKLTRFARIITQAIGQQKRHSLRHWIHSTWLALGGPALLLNSADQENMNTFFTVLDHYEQGGAIKQWDDIEKAVNDLYAKPKKDSEDDGVSNSLHKPVQIMTIHKSKGLEFDTVIIPALDKNARSNDKELILWLERIGYSSYTQQQESQLLISPMNATGEDPDPIYDFIRLQHTQKEQLESDRLLYVGCTRAIKQLHLIGYAAIDDKKDNGDKENNEAFSESSPPLLQLEDLKKPSQRTLLSRLWQNIERSIEKNINSIEKNEAGDCHITFCSNHNHTSLPLLDGALHNHKLKHPNVIVSLPESWQAPTLTANTILEAYRGNNALAKIDKTPKPVAVLAAAQSDLFGDDQTSPSDGTFPPTTFASSRLNVAKPDALLQREQRYIGIVIHLALQHITETGHQHWDTQRITKQLPVWKSQLAQKGITPLALKHALNTVESAIRNTLNDPKGQWLLDKSHPQSATELELWDKHGQHIIDRSFVTKDSIENEEQVSKDTKNTSKANDKATRWIIDYKSSQAKTGENPEDFIRQQTQEYRKQLTRYKKLFAHEDSNVRTALYFPLTSTWAEV